MDQRVMGADTRACMHVHKGLAVGRVLRGDATPGSVLVGSAASARVWRPHACMLGYVLITCRTATNVMGMGRVG